jgi:hypothetical protein
MHSSIRALPCFVLELSLCCLETAFVPVVSLLRQNSTMLLLRRDGSLDRETVRNKLCILHILHLASWHPPDSLLLFFSPFAGSTNCPIGAEHALDHPPCTREVQVYIAGWTIMKFAIAREFPRITQYSPPIPPNPGSLVCFTSRMYVSRAISGSTFLFWHKLSILLGVQCIPEFQSFV